MKIIKKYVIPALILIAIVNVIFLLLRYNKEKQNKLNSQIETMEYNASALACRNIGNTVIDSFGNNRVNIANALHKNNYLLLIIMDPSGCGSCLDEKILWNRIQNRKIVRELVIATYNNKNELNNYLKNSKIEVPVIQDSTYSSIKILHPLATPVKLLLNKNGKIVLADYVRNTKQSRRLFLEALIYYIRKNQTSI